jgi:indole-3-glycerol phosphate synthase
MILDEILAHKRAEIAERSRVRSLSNLKAGLSDRADAAGGRFRDALQRPGVSIIAEIKRKSPSGGALRPDLSATDLARAFANNGAAALSVLTDYRYFGGDDSDLVDARAASGLPVLRKDFVVDVYQVFEARALGADAVLLIVRALEQSVLVDLLAATHGLGCEALVETHSAVEVERALTAGARIVGVNNRDLDTLRTDTSLAPRLRPSVPTECVFVAESGISEPEQIAELAAAGVDAVLIGEALVRARDPGAKLATLVGAGLAPERIA